jgi:RNA binding exosome subunit
MHAVQLDAQSEAGSDDGGTSTLIDIDTSLPAGPPPVGTANSSAAQQMQMEKCVRARSHAHYGGCRDQMIRTLQNDLEDAKQFIYKFRMDGQRAIEQYENRISQLEYDVQKSREAVEATQQVCASVMRRCSNEQMQENARFREQAQAHLSLERQQHAADGQEAQSEQQFL